MTGTVVALAFVAVLAAVAGCGDEATTAPAPATTTPSSATSAAAASSTSTAPTLVPASGLRAQTCRDFLPMLDEIRQIDQAAATQMAETTITNLPSTPEWAGLSETDRAATVAGIRDAAAGTCQ